MGFNLNVLSHQVLEDWDRNAFIDITMDEVISRDMAGEFPRVLTNPMLKDTVTVHARGGYSIIQFRADNPGMSSRIFSFSRQHGIGMTKEK